jgi:3-oxoacyl-[acyl-carrier-protein] synthase II
MTAPIAITGIGLLSPFGIGMDIFVDALATRQCAIRELTVLDASRHRWRWAAEMSDFDPTPFLGSRGLRYFDRTALLLSSAARLAVDASRDVLEAYDRTEVGLAAGTTYGSTDSIARFDRDILTLGPRLVSPMQFPNMVMNAPAGRAAILCGLRGPNATIGTGEASGIDALEIARTLVLTGQARAMLAGGVHALTEEVYHACERRGLLFAGEGAWSDLNGIPGPFDRARAGAVLGEAAALLVLERVEAAAERAVPVLGVLSGYGTAFAVGGPHDVPTRQAAAADAMAAALADAGLSPANVGAVFVHANGTRLGDRIEAQALVAVFGPRLARTPLVTIKGSVGECLEAAGVLQVVAALGALDRQELPVAFRTPDLEPEWASHCVIDRPRPFAGDHCLVNAVSREGVASSVVISRAPGAADRTASARRLAWEPLERR